MNTRKTGSCCALVLMIALAAIPYVYAHYGMCCYLHGLVIDKVTGKPVPSAQVGILYSRGGSDIMTFSTKTNFKGEYGIWLYARQMITLVVWKDGYERTNAAVYLKVGVWNVRLDVEIMPTGTGSLAATEAVGSALSWSYYSIADAIVSGSIRKYE